MEKDKKKFKLQWKLIVPIICAFITAYGGYLSGNSKGQEQKSVELLPVIEKYEGDLKEKDKEIELLKAQLEDAGKSINTTDSSQTEVKKVIDENGVSLMETYKFFDNSLGFKDKTYENFNMSGKEYSGGFVFRETYDGNNVSFNIDKKYTLLTFDIGHVDDSRKEGAILHIMLDGKTIKSINLNATDPIQNYQIDVTEGEVLRFTWDTTDEYTTGEYGLANIKLF